MTAPVIRKVSMPEALRFYAAYLFQNDFWMEFHYYATYYFVDDCCLTFVADGECVIAIDTLGKWKRGWLGLLEVIGNIAEAEGWKCARWETVMRHAKEVHLVQEVGGFCWEDHRGVTNYFIELNTLREGVKKRRERNTRV